MTTALLLTAALAVQQPDLQDAESVIRLLASLRSAEPAVCELAGRSLTNYGGWWDGDLPVPMPMPTPTPMPWAGGGVHVRVPSIGSRGGADMDARVLEAYRGALKDSSRCIRHIAARMVARARPAWAAADFGRLAKAPDAGLRETGLLGLGELEDPATLSVMTGALRDRDAAVRAMAAWALGELELPDAISALARALDDEAPAVRRRAAWALGQIEDEAALAPLERALRDRAPEVRQMAIWAVGEIESGKGVAMLAGALADADGRTRRMAAWALVESFQKSGCWLSAWRAASSDSCLARSKTHRRVIDSVREGGQAFGQFQRAAPLS